MQMKTVHMLIMFFSFACPNAAFGLQARVVQAFRVDGFVRQCVLYSGQPNQFERAVRTYVSTRLPITPIYRSWQVHFVSNKRDCQRLAVYSWEFPEIQVVEARYRHRRLQLQTSSFFAALIWKTSRGTRLFIRKGADFQSVILGVDPTDYHDVGCRLLLVSGGQTGELPNVRYLSGFLKCTRPLFAVEAAKWLAEEVRQRLGLRSSRYTRLFLRTNSCASFQDLEFPAYFIFEEETRDTCDQGPPRVISAIRNVVCTEDEMGELKCAPLRE